LIADRVPEIRVVRGSAPAEFVLLPADELAEIVEDAAALAAYERTRGEETVPFAVVDRLLANENAVKVWREHRGLTLTALAGRAGIGKGYLSQIEHGTRHGPVATMQKLADALNVDLDDLT
jgi:DNA-binding XRE family transcriptional regulator